MYNVSSRDSSLRIAVELVRLVLNVSYSLWRELVAVKCHLGSVY